MQLLYAKSTLKNSYTPGCQSSGATELLPDTVVASAFTVERLLFFVLQLPTLPLVRQNFSCLLTLAEDRGIWSVFGLQWKHLDLSSSLSYFMTCSNSLSF